MPIKNTHALLARLIAERAESAWLEFKQNNSDPEMIGRCVSACANGAILAGKERAFIVFGIENGSKKKVGTAVRLTEMTKGGENFQNWLTRMLEPRLMIEFLDFEEDGLRFSIITIEPSYDRQDLGMLLPLRRPVAQARLHDQYDASGSFQAEFD